MKKMNNKGFTLMELLIVVAIIAVLVAIAIPVMNSQLEKAREATDVANMRSAKAVAVVGYLSEGTTGTKYFDVVSGTLKDTKAEISKGYGKGTNIDGGMTEMGYAAGTATKDQIIEVIIADDGGVTLNWVAKQ